MLLRYIVLYFHISQSYSNYTEHAHDIYYLLYNKIYLKKIKNKM